MSFETLLAGHRFLLRRPRTRPPSLNRGRRLPGALPDKKSILVRDEQLIRKRSYLESDLASQGVPLLSAPAPLNTYAGILLKNTHVML